MKKKVLLKKYLKINKDNEFFLLTNSGILKIINNYNNNIFNYYLVNLLVKNLIKLFFLKYYYFKEIYLKGLGYHVSIKNNYLRFAIGYNHFIFLRVPINVKVYTKKDSLIIFGLNKNVLNMFVKKIKLLKKNNSYKKQGLYTNLENIKLKKGKQLKN